jgi:hypothetical protein
MALAWLVAGLAARLLAGLVAWFLAGLFARLLARFLAAGIGRLFAALVVPLAWLIAWLAAARVRFAMSGLTRLPLTARHVLGLRDRHGLAIGFPWTGLHIALAQTVHRAIYGIPEDLQVDSL